MSITPANSLSVWLDNLAAMLSASATWQGIVAYPAAAWGDAGLAAAITAAAADLTYNRASAATRIAKFWQDETQLSPLRPRIVVRSRNEENYTRATQDQWFCNSAFLLYVELDVPSALQGDANYQQAGIDFQNKVGGIIDDLLDFSASNTADPATGRTFLDLTRIESVMLGQADPKENDNLQFWVYEATLYAEGRP